MTMYMPNKYGTYIKVDWVFPDEAGNRTKQEFPYSYSPFFIWRTKDKDQLQNGLYHDRMIEWDRKKFRSALDKYGNNLSRYDQKTLSEFLSYYLEKSVQATALAEGCNASNGYPVYMFWYEEL